MSALPVISCQGAPRDLGLDQGIACAEAIGERLRRAGGRGDWLGRWRPFGRGDLERARATARDVRRHFPHLDERVIGLARGAKAPEIALAHLLARELGPDGEGASLQSGFDREGRLVLHGPRAGILRRADSDVGFASVEWTLPWLPGAYAGVNGAGLAGGVASRGTSDGAGCAAPAFLLLQNCLAQFETAENAVEWCERRPAGGHAELIFSDATGARAAVGIEGEKRVRIEPAAASAGAGEGAKIRLVLDQSARSLEAATPDGSARIVPSEPAPE